MAVQIIPNFTNKLKAVPPPSNDRKDELITKCLKVCSTLAPLIYLNRINGAAIIDFAQEYTHQLRAEALEQARPYLTTIVDKYNNNSRVGFAFIRGFNDQYEVKDTTPLGIAIKARNEDDINTILSTVPVQDLKYIGKSHINLLSMLTKLLLVKSIQHLATLVSDLEFDDLYTNVKDEFTETPIDNLSNRIYKTTEQMAKARAIVKVFLTKNINIIDENKSRLKRKHIFPSMPAAIEHIKTRRGERRTPIKRATPYPDAYFILGHGGDFNFHTTFRVPKDCAVIAKATTGQLMDTTKIGVLEPLYDLHSRPYINPLKKENLLYLIDKYKYFSLFTEQSYYPNFTYTLLSVFPIEEYYRLGYSGIIKHPFRTPEGEIIDSQELMDTVHIRKSEKLSLHAETIINSYKYSMYPRPVHVRNLIAEYLDDTPMMTVEEFVDKVEIEQDNIIRVSQKFLFEELTEGIFYNFVCRASLFTDKLYTNGFVLDDSLRGLITSGGYENIEVRGGLRKIISEALTTRAGIIKAAMKAANVGAANESASMGLAASASAGSAASPSIASRFVKMRSMIIKLRQKFTNEKFFEFIEYLQPRISNLLGSLTDEIVVENQQYLSEQLPDLFEKITNIREHYVTIIKFLNELYIEGHIVMEGSDPSYLKQLQITNELKEYISQQTNDALIDRFKNKPVYILEYMKNSNLHSLFHLAISAHKYKFAKWLFEKCPRLSRVDVPMFGIKPYYFDLFKIKGAYVPAYEPLRDIVGQTGDIIKPIFVVTHLKNDTTNDARALYKIFEPYILERNLHIQYPVIRTMMRRFGMLAAEAAAPPPAAAAAAPTSKLAKTIATLRAKLRKPLNSNSNSNSSNSNSSSNKKNTTKKKKGAAAASNSSSSSSSNSSGKGKKTIKNPKKSFNKSLNNPKSE
jgi:hypothetical protein